jgi:hypothetical protein
MRLWPMGANTHLFLKTFARRANGTERYTALAEPQRVFYVATRPDGFQPLRGPVVVQGNSLNPRGNYEVVATRARPPQCVFGVTKSLNKFVKDSRFSKSSSLLAR